MTGWIPGIADRRIEIRMEGAGLKIGLIGAGMIAGAHANAYRRMREAQVVAVTDLRPDRARKLGERLNASVYATVAELLADPEVEAVDICVPTPEHGQIVLAAAAARK
ncbi:MAG: gfo/Idh/MocA family oxidoreductase, partial [Firmicutes bacterium]|nr:gfo/Idh/MocA family oxidoreductase [Bacillota bacterium]